MNRLRIAMVLALLAVAGVVGWQVVKPSDEPVYKGRRLTSWLNAGPEQVSFGQELEPLEREAYRAVREAGSNAIPTLMRLLRKEDSALKSKLMGKLVFQSGGQFGYTPARILNYRVVTAFVELGTNGQSAVPELIEIAGQNISRSSRTAAIRSLYYVGPAAREAVPYLLRWTTNADSDFRLQATNALLRIDAEAAARAGITNAP